jgi:dienelactone hydrolase
MKAWRWLWRLSAVALAAAVVLAFALGNPIAWGQAALIMWDIAAGGKATPWQDLTDPPSEYVMHWRGGEGDVYEPAGTSAATLVLVPGAVVLGRDEPRLKALARSFARAGFVVLVPELPEVRRLALSRADADRIASALEQMYEWRPAQPLGIAAVSYAVAPAVIAVLQDHLADKVDFVVGIGGYRDAEAAIRFVTTGTFRPMGEAREFQMKPSNYGRWVFLLSNADRLDDRNDGALLRAIAQARSRDSGADIAPLAAKLGPQGRAVLALVANRDPEAVTRLMGQLPEKVRREIDGLNLALYDLSKLKGDLILVHGRGDPLVPYSESQALAAAASNAHVSLFLIDDLGHVDFNGVTAANAWAMWRAILALLQERR